MTIPESWGLSKLQDELDLAARSVLHLESQMGQPEIAAGLGTTIKPRAIRLADWRAYEHELRDRMTVLGLNAELDALEAK